MVRDAESSWLRKATCGKWMKVIYKERMLSHLCEFTPAHVFFLIGRRFPRWVSCLEDDSDEMYRSTMKYQGCTLTLRWWWEGQSLSLSLCQSCVEMLPDSKHIPNQFPQCARVDGERLQDDRIMRAKKYLGSRKSCFYNLFDHNSDAFGDTESDQSKSCSIG